VLDEDSGRLGRENARARHLAEKGEAAVEGWQALVDRAREMLASGDVEPPRSASAAAVPVGNHRGAASTLPKVTKGIVPKGGAPAANN
jgi:hypothetical protein